MIKAEDLINLSEKQEEIRELLYSLSTEGCIGIDRDGTIFTIIVSAEEEEVEDEVIEFIKAHSDLPLLRVGYLLYEENILSKIEVEDDEE